MQLDQNILCRGLAVTSRALTSAYPWPPMSDWYMMQAWRISRCFNKSAMALAWVLMEWVVRETYGKNSWQASEGPGMSSFAMHSQQCSGLSHRDGEGR